MYIMPLQICRKICIPVTRRVEFQQGATPTLAPITLEPHLAPTFRNI